MLDISTKTSQTNTPKYLMILVMLFITTYLATGMVQYRLVELGPLYFSSAIYIYPLSYLICDIVTEIYGYRISRQLVWCGMAAWIIAGLFVSFAISLHPPTFWHSYANKFDFIMHPYLRYALSSAAGVLIGQFLNIYVISKMKILARGRFFWFRSVSSSFIGDGITIFIALVFIYWGTMSFSRILTIIGTEIVINIIYSALIAFPAIFIVKYLKQAEGLDTYDIGINYNPFSLSVDK